MPSSSRLSSSPSAAARTSPTMSSAGQQTFDVRQDLAAQLAPSSRRTSTDSKSTLWTYASTMAPSKKDKKHETRQALSVSPPSYTDAVTTSDKKAAAMDTDDAVLQDVVGKYGLGTSMMCPKVPEFEPKKAKAAADTKAKSQSRTPDADDLALQSAMGQYGFGGSMMCPKVPDFEAKDTKKPGKATRSGSSSSSSSSKSSSSRESLKKAWQRVKSVSPPQTAADFLSKR